MKTFQEFMHICEAAYDKEVMSGSQIRTMGAGGRISPERKKSKPEVKRMKSVTDPKTGKVTRVPVDYKPRTDIGAQRETSTRVQQPQQERGSAEVRAKAAAAAREERRKAALARAAARKSGAAPSETKPAKKDVEKEASKLLSTKKPAEKKPSGSGEKEDHMIRGALLPKGEPKRPYTRDEKKKIVRAGKRLSADLQAGRDKPASVYQSTLEPTKKKG